MEHETTKTTTSDDANNSTTTTTTATIDVERLWIDVPDSNGQLHLLSVRGGYDREAVPNYIGRVAHEGCTSVANVKQPMGVALYPWHGAELTATSYQVLTGDSFNWEWYDLNDPQELFPAYAVRAGRTADGASIYIGRGRHNSCLIVGNVYGNTRTGLHIPFEGSEVRLTRFQVLTLPI